MKVADQTVLEDTIRPVQEGVFYARRPGHERPVPESPFEYLGLFWTEDEKRVLSLAVGELHGSYFAYHPDYELYALEWDREGPYDICCHGSFKEAEACALGAFLTGKWCSDLEQESA